MPLVAVLCGMVAAQAVLPGLRCVDLSGSSQSVKPTTQLCGTQQLTHGDRHVVGSFEFVSSHARPCRVSKKPGAREQQQLPDVEFEECVDPGVEVWITCCIVR